MDHARDRSIAPAEEARDVAALPLGDSVAVRRYACPRHKALNGRAAAFKA
jgi:hypothetical protein